MVAEVIVDDGEVLEHLRGVTTQPGGGLKCLAGRGPVGIGGRNAIRVLVKGVIPGLDCICGFVRGKRPGLRDRCAGLSDRRSGLRRLIVGIGQVRQDDGRDGQRRQGK